MQRHVAQISANGSSLRNQGMKGMVAIAQAFLANLVLGGFVTASEVDFQARLDQETEVLQLAFPVGGQNFGDIRGF